MVVQKQMRSIYGLPTILGLSGFESGTVLLVSGPIDVRTHSETEILKRVVKIVNVGEEDGREELE